MWTVCWVEHEESRNHDRWDRVIGSELLDFLRFQNLVNEYNEIDEDVLIFPPRSEASYSSLRDLEIRTR